MIRDISCLLIFFEYVFTEHLIHMTSAKKMNQNVLFSGLDLASPFEIAWGKVGD